VWGDPIDGSPLSLILRSASSTCNTDACPTRNARVEAKRTGARSVFKDRRILFESLPDKPPIDGGSPNQSTGVVMAKIRWRYTHAVLTIVRFTFYHAVSQPRVPCRTMLLILSFQFAGIRSYVWHMLDF
jgi:hypothetical protein